MSAHCRIGRVRLKAGGAELKLFRQTPAMIGHVELTHSARVMVDQHFPEEPISFVLLAWSDSGQFSVGWHHREESAIPRTLMPSYMAEVLRRRMITEFEVRDLLGLQPEGA